MIPFLTYLKSFNGFKRFRGAYWVVFGGISSCLDFAETPNSKIWGQGAEKGEFMPKNNSKEGKLIYKEIGDLPAVSIMMLNMCIGFNGDPFKCIGFSDNNEQYFGFSLADEWNVAIPSDCEEVILPKYKELFSKEPSTTQNK